MQLRRRRTKNPLFGEGGRSSDLEVVLLEVLLGLPVEPLHQGLELVGVACGRRSAPRALDFGGSDSSKISVPRGGALVSMGSLRKIPSRRISLGKL